MDNANSATLNKIIEILLEKKQPHQNNNKMNAKSSDGSVVTNTVVNKTKDDNKDNKIDIDTSVIIEKLNEINEISEINTTNLSDIAKAVIETYNALNDNMLEVADVNEKVVNKYLRLIDSTKAIDTIASDSISSSDVITASFEKVFAQFELINKNVSNISNVAETFNLDNISDQLKKTMNNAAVESSNLGNKFEQEIDKQLLTGTAMKSTTAISRSVDSFFSRVKNNLQTPFRLAADIIQLPKNIKNSMADLISSVKENVSDFKEGIMTGDFSRLFMSDKAKDEQLKVGISTKTIDINKVLKHSTAGISAVWLFSKLEKLFNGNSSGLLGDKDSDSLSITDLVASEGITGMAKMAFKYLMTSPAGMAIMTGLGYAATAIAGVGLYFSMAYNRIKTAKAKGETAEKVLELKEGKKATSGQELLVGASQAAAGSVGSGTYKERTMNGISNAAQWGSVGMLTGGTLGLIGGPAGAAIGALAGGAIGVVGGYITGIIGDKNLAKGINDLNEKVISLGTGSDKYKKNVEDINKTSVEVSDGFFGEIKTLWDKLRGLFGFGPKPNDIAPPNPKQIGRENNTPNPNYIEPKFDYSKNNSVHVPDDKHAIIGDFNPTSNPSNLKVNPVLGSTIKYIGSNEGGGAGAVNKSDGPGVGASLGTYNWNRGRAQGLIEDMLKADRPTFEKHMGEEFMKRYNAHGSWGIKGRGGLVFSETDKRNWQGMIKEQKTMKPEDAKILAADTRKAINDGAGYNEQARRAGLTDPRAIILYSDYMNRNGHGPKLAKGQTSYEDVLRAASDNFVDAGRHNKPNSRKIMEYWGTEEAKTLAAAPVSETPGLNVAKTQKEDATTNALTETAEQVKNATIAAVTAKKVEASPVEPNKNEASTVNNLVDNSSSSSGGSGGSLDVIPTFILTYFFGVNEAMDFLRSGK